MILRPDERHLGMRGKTSSHNAVRLVFSAKEALYKAVHAQVRRFIDFQEVKIVIGPGTNSFSATAPDDTELDALVSRGRGRYLVTRDLVFTYWCQKAAIRD